MCLFTRRSWLVTWLIWLSGNAWAQAAPAFEFVQNNRQWPDAVRFRAAVPGGTVFLTATGLVYDWQHAADWEHAHDVALHAAGPAGAEADAVLRRHAVFVDFVGARAVAPRGQQPSEAYHNYFLGADASRWAAHVPLFGEVLYPGLYANTDLRVYGAETGTLKYDFVVRPGGQPAAIALRYRGPDALRLQADGSLLVQTSVTDVVEQRPVAYQEVHGQRQPVPCRYRLVGNELRYEFPAGYDARRPLVIDPAVVACTYSGGTGETWGATTGYDAGGNSYVASWAQTSGYPVTPGAYQTTLRSNSDVGLSKFDPSGRQLLYATYLGGSSGDNVQAVRVSAAGEAYVLTSTSSSDYPVKTGCFDPSYNGNADLALTRLNAAGSALVGSTYLGSTGNETGSDLVLTSTGVAVAGNTFSPAFPTTPGAFSRTLSGGQDVFLTSLNDALTTVNWSTFLGGNGTEAATALAAAPNGDILVGGNTGSATFPTTPGTLRTTYAAPGDGFITRLRANGTGLVASTFVGSPSAADFVTGLDFDGAGNVLYVGNATGPVAATSGALALGGAVFVGKLNAQLSAQSFLAVPFAPGFALQVTAFKTDACGNTYLAGFAAGSGAAPVVNPLPNGAFGGLYTMSLNATGTARLFGSFFGPGGQHAHSNVHRFDEQGNLYQSVCTTNVYPTVAGGYAPVRRSNGFDALLLKINQPVAGSLAVRAAVAPVDSMCAPGRVAFVNASTGSKQYRWNFADGTAVDTARNPQHVFQNPGTYRVQLVALGSTGACIIRNDTAYVTVRVTQAVQAPNVITPNGDRLNDTFRPTGAAVPGTRLRLYNRWGREVYATDNYRNDWGPEQPAGIYYYVLENPAFCHPYTKGWLEVLR